MVEGWVWHDLVRDLSGSTHLNDIRHMAHSADVDPIISIDGMYAPDADSFDSYEYDYKKDRYYIMVGIETGSLEIMTSSVEAQLLGRIDKASSFEMLANELTRLIDNPWIWINYHAGFFLSTPENTFDTKKRSRSWEGLQILVERYLAAT
jgi:hypothetical protein